MFSAGWGVGVGWGRGDEKEAGDIKTAPCLDRLGGACAQLLDTSFILNFSFQDRKSKMGGRQIGQALTWVQTTRLTRAVFWPFFMAETVG